MFLNGIRNIIGGRGFWSERDEDSSTNTLLIESETTFNGVIVSGQKAETVSVTSDLTISGNSSSIYLIDASANPIDITLPNITNNDGYILKIKKTDQTANNIVISGFSESQTIDGNTSKTMTLPYTALTLVSKNGKWWIV